MDPYTSTGGDDGCQILNHLKAIEKGIEAFQFDLELMDMLPKVGQKDYIDQFWAKMPQVEEECSSSVSQANVKSLSSSKYHGRDISQVPALLYVVYYHQNLVTCSRRYVRYLYTIHALDMSLLSSVGEGPSPSPKPLPPPILKLSCREYPLSMGFGQIGSSIYLIGGCDIVGGNSPVDCLRTYKLDTGLVTSYDSTIKRPGKVLRPGPRLNAIKESPIVVPLGEKLYILASSWTKGSPRPLMEVLSPDSDVCGELMEPPSSSDEETYDIKAHCIIKSKGIIIIQMKNGIFGLDTHRLGLGWTEFSSTLGVSCLPFWGSPCHVDNMWWFISYTQMEAFDSMPPIRPVTLINFPDMSPELRWFDEEHSMVEYGNGNKTLLFIRAGLEEKARAPNSRLRINVDNMVLKKKKKKIKSKEKEGGGGCGTTHVWVEKKHSVEYFMEDITGEAGSLCGCFAIDDAPKLKTRWIG